MVSNGTMDYLGRSSGFQSMEASMDTEYLCLKCIQQYGLKIQLRY